MEKGRKDTLRAGSVDFRRLGAAEINILAQSLINKCQADGNLTFDGHRKSEEELDNEASARRFTERIKKKLTDCRPYEAQQLIDTYDILYRIGYGRRPSVGTLLPPFSIRRSVTESQ